MTAGGSSPGSPGSATLELLLFELDGVLCGADASQVLRIDEPPSSRLPAPAGERRARALVYRVGEGEGRFQVDRVHGVRTAGMASLRRMPRVVRAPGVIGLWLDSARPIVLFDLLQTYVSDERER